MKVLMVSPGKSGPLKNTQLIAKGLTKLNDQVYVYLLDPPEYCLDFKDIVLNEPHRSAKPSSYFDRVVRIAMLKNTGFSPEVILTSFALSIPPLKAFFPRIPIVYRMMGFPRTQFSEGVEKLAYAMEASMAKRYARELHAVTTAEHYSRLIRREWKIDVPYIHNGVDTDFYRPPESKTEVKRILGLLQYEYIVTLGLTRFNDVFRPLTYVEWYLDSLRHQKDKRIMTLILGKTNTNQKQLLKKSIDNYLAREQPSQHSFKIECIRNNRLLRNYYQASDLFISFMRQSLMEKEALACGLPVVTEFWEGTNAQNELSILEHKLVKKRFIEIISTLLQDQNVREEYSKKARIVAVREFSYDIMASQYHKILHHAIRAWQLKS